MNAWSGTTALAVLLACATGASALGVDGRLDAEYGTALSVQTVQTSFFDSSPSFPPNVGRCTGGELDQGFGFLADGVLHLFLAGNLQSFFSEPLYLPHQLVLFIDCQPGGQNTLRADNPAVGYSDLDLGDLAGLTFDQDFAADYWLEMTLPRCCPMPIEGYYAELPAAGGGAGYGLGSAEAGGPGTFSGGTNPYNVLATIDETNRAGVTAGCEAGSGAGVSMGAEWAIPLGAIGNPTGAIKVCALIGAGWGLSNQVLGPLPVGSCSLDAPASVDFARIPGSQYFTIAGATPASSSTWGRLKTLYR